MIKSWRLLRFKSVYDKTELPFAPLTLFAGINNSGKSTVIQSILLTSQTLANPMRKRPVSLNGHLARLGTFNDIVSNGHESDAISIGFRLTDIDELELRGTANRPVFAFRLGHSSDLLSIDADYSFSARSTSESERKEIVQLQPVLEKSTIRLSYMEDGRQLDTGAFEFTRRTEPPIHLKAQLDLDAAEQRDASELAFEVTKMPIHPGPAYDPYFSKGEVVGVLLDHFIPRALVSKYDRIEEESKQALNAFIGRHDYPARVTLTEDSFARLPDQFKDIVIQRCNDIVIAEPSGRLGYTSGRSATALDDFTQSFTPERFRRFLNTLAPPTRSSLLQRLAEQSDLLENIVRAGRQPSYGIRLQGLPLRFEGAVDYITEYFASGIKYLAPLRDEPKPVYPLAASTDPSDIGLKGEHTAAVLELNRSEDIKYVPSAAFSSETANVSIATESLGHAVLDWMRYMGVVTNIETHDLGSLGHDLKVATGTSSSLRDLTHVGVGVSQVLPIVVLCLISPRGSVLIFEQPELHLHPRVQSRLADFFLSMTYLGKQCIVETHSEHLITRLRQRTAAAPGDEIASRVIMYFVEAEDGKSQYRPIQISPYGTIQNWPKGFFDEGEELATAILKAGIRKRKSEAPLK